MRSQCLLAHRLATITRLLALVVSAQSEMCLDTVQISVQTSAADQSNSYMMLGRAYLPFCSGYGTCRGAVIAARPVGLQVWAKVQSKHKLVTVKRSGRNKKVAVSHFGKRQLKLPGSPDKPKKTEHPASSQRSNTGRPVPLCP